MVWLGGGEAGGPEGFQESGLQEKKNALLAARPKCSKNYPRDSPGGREAAVARARPGFQSGAGQPGQAGWAGPLGILPIALVTNCMAAWRHGRLFV